MSIQKRLYKGFTLIELMVVIVIIGILAAIAIPKLFGVSAKAKASEVGPAAGTWVKLQQAFIAETGLLGSFGKIGYTPPGASTTQTNTGSTGNFNYAGLTLTGNDDSAAAGSVGWSAGTRTALGGDCTTANAVWSVTVDVSSVLNASPPGDACGKLTPNFSNLK